MVKDYDKDNVIVIKCIFILFYANCPIASLPKIYLLKIFTYLHDDVTEMVYIDTMILINLSSNAL